MALCEPQGRDRRDELTEGTEGTESHLGFVSKLRFLKICGFLLGCLLSFGTGISFEGLQGALLGSAFSHVQKSQVLSPKAKVGTRVLVISSSQKGEPPLFPYPEQSEVNYLIQYHLQASRKEHPAVTAVCGYVATAR